MSLIHPLACIDPKAQLADDVEVGPFCVIGPKVRIGARTRLLNHVTVIGNTTIGSGNVIYPNAVLGAAPQDKKFRGEDTQLVIGDNNQIREAVTLHLGTEKGGGVTRLGSNNLLMINVHLGHDCNFGDHNVISNNTMVAGHVLCGNHVAMMGGVGVHHFVTIGDFAYIAGYARIHHDVPPYVKVADDDRIRALNEVGLKRAGYTEADIAELEEAVRELFIRKERPLAQVIASYDLTNGINPHVRNLVEFIARRTSGKHGRYLESMRK